MTELLPINTEKSSITMSSREIAELCGKQHNHVLRDIRAYVGAILQIERGINVKSLDWSEKEGVELFGHTPIGGVVCQYEVNSQNNQRYPIYYLDKSATLTVISGYNVILRKRIIDRWLELENQQQSTALSLSRKELALMILQAEEEKERLQLENKQQSTHIASMESYFRNGISPFEFVKGLNGVNSLKVGEFLIGKNWLYQDNRTKRVKAYARDQYLTEETTEISQHGKEPFIAYKPVLLKKGAAKLYEWYVKGNLPMKANWNGEFTQDKAVGL
ncbi:Rha family transcriptional regulator [Avibacterium paragallinarum]|uniref:Rha family transcriptional regulator n=1 Tax=Avibacterium paragallinarum TaxID=728 RepID=UPI0021F7F973|nr:Rha family transcriptional regulator [Avibacterium paragallinarum]UXN37537.1 Rha family transcriptional regulator [Avibacterium paragallinarum]